MKASRKPAPSCPTADRFRDVSRDVAEFLSVEAPALYGADFGAIVIHYCHDCECTHVSVVNHLGGAVTPRVLAALELATELLKEETQKHGNQENCN